MKHHIYFSKYLNTVSVDTHRCYNMNTYTFPASGFYNISVYSHNSRVITAYFKAGDTFQVDPNSHTTIYLVHQEQLSIQERNVDKLRKAMGLS